MTPNGRLLPNGGGHSGGAVANLIKAHLSAFFLRQQARPAIKFQNPADLVALKSLVKSGRVVPVLDATYPLSDTPRAVGHVGAGHARGTVVITV
jgi:NADPH:quinone reductase-like Zn-dependent oxidoreductase